MGLQQLGIDNLVRGATFFQHSGIAITFVFMPIIVKGVTESLFEIGIVVASFFFAQILSEIYFGRISDKKGIRLQFIRIGFVGCAVTFALHYFADDATLLLLARLGAGITTGIMIPAMLAYSYEAEKKDKRKVASIVSFQAMGWLVGIVAAVIWLLIWRGAVCWSRSVWCRTLLFAGGLILLPTLLIFWSESIPSATESYLFGIPFLAWGFWMAATVRYWPMRYLAGASGDFPPTCVACGYPLTGLCATRCPECGDERTIDELWRAHASEIP